MEGGAEGMEGGEGRHVVQSLSSRSVYPQPAEAMPALGTVCSLLLSSALWVDLARVGSRSLSLKHQKVQVRHLPMSPAF